MAGRFAFLPHRVLRDAAFLGASDAVQHLIIRIYAYCDDYGRVPGQGFAMQAVLKLRALPDQCTIDELVTSGLALTEERDDGTAWLRISRWLEDMPETRRKRLDSDTFLACPRMPTHMPRHVPAHDGRTDARACAESLAEPSLAELSPAKLTTRDARAPEHVSTPAPETSHAPSDAGAVSEPPSKPRAPGPSSAGFSGRQAHPSPPEPPFATPEPPSDCTSSGGSGSPLRQVDGTDDFEARWGTNAPAGEWPDLSAMSYVAQNATMDWCANVWDTRQKTAARKRSGASQAKTTPQSLCQMFMSDLMKLYGEFDPEDYADGCLSHVKIQKGKSGKLATAIKFLRSRIEQAAEARTSGLPNHQAVAFDREHRARAT